MIFLIHRNGLLVKQVFKDQKEIAFEKGLVDTLWKLAEDYPSEIIIWLEEEQERNLETANISSIFHQDLIMASYAVKHAFLDGRIGYVDQSPFINIKRDVSFPTWLMSSDVGGIKGEVLLCFRELFRGIKNFDYLLNSMAKIGQQNGLFCYSEPRLVKDRGEGLVYKASNKQLFSFVFQFYKKFRAVVLFWCVGRYQHEWLVSAFLLGMRERSYFSATVTLQKIKVSSLREQMGDQTIDVIIPTIGRPEHCLNVLRDLKNQTLLPQKVIVVEQNPDTETSSGLSEIYSQVWPFEIKHIFTHKTGACRARNMCLDLVSSAWVFMCDDDIRIPGDVLKNCLKVTKKIGVNVLSLNCKQPQEKNIYDRIKQWGAFGSGTSFVSSACVDKIRFDTNFELGFAEDMDFGMQLRNRGNDIIYHPGIEITHLKAPMGGFRTELEKPWDNAATSPKPSPTVMLYGLKHYTRSQMLGYKNLLWMKFYREQEIKNPLRYISSMKERWKASEILAERLISKFSGREI